MWTISEVQQFVRFLCTVYSRISDNCNVCFFFSKWAKRMDGRWQIQYSSSLTSWGGGQKPINFQLIFQIQTNLTYFNSQSIILYFHYFGHIFQNTRTWNAQWPLRNLEDLLTLGMTQGSLIHRQNIMKNAFPPNSNDTDLLGRYFIVEDLSDRPSILQIPFLWLFFRHYLTYLMTCVIKLSKKQHLNWSLWYLTKPNLQSIQKGTKPVWLYLDVCISCPR